MKTYISTKTVQAALIKEIVDHHKVNKHQVTGSLLHERTLVLANGDGPDETAIVTEGWIARNEAAAGGYFVRHQGGTETFKFKDDFESEFTEPKQKRGKFDAE